MRAFINTRDVEEWPEPEVAENVNTDELGNLGLSLEQELAIVAFMRTLSDGYVPDALPFGQPVLALGTGIQRVSDGSLRYTLPDAQPVRLEIFDVLGRRLAVLHQGMQAAGEHQVSLAPQRLGSGVFWARVHSGKETASTRFVVVR